MDSLSNLVDVAQLGSTVILLVILFFLWQEFKEQNKFIRDQLTQADAERRALAEAMGMSSQQLQYSAELVKRRMENAPKN